MSSMLTIRGYTDKPSVEPGEEIQFHISSDRPGPFQAQLLRIINGDEDPAGPGPKNEIIVSDINGEHQVEQQETRPGGHIVVKSAPAIDEAGISLHLFVYPTSPAGRRQGLLGQQSEDGQRGWLLFIQDGHLHFSIGDGAETAEVTSKRALIPEAWYSVAASYDPKAGSMTVTQRAIVTSTNGRFGPVVNLDSDGSESLSTGLKLAGADAPIILAAVFQDEWNGRVRVVDHYNGKIDSPRIVRGTLFDADIEALSQGQVFESSREIAHWNFAESGTVDGFPSDDITDMSGNGLHGVCINTPDRGMTGWNWSGKVEHFAFAPEQYGAIWFHEESLDDARWQPTVAMRVPDGLRSGVYALRATQGDYSDDIIFFVRPKRGTRPVNKILMLMPTYTYTCYGNVNVPAEAAGQTIFAHTTTLDPREIEVNARSKEYGLSAYDYHLDGRGNQYTSWRRPILNMRPQHRYSTGTLWNFPSDLYIINFLETQGFDYDVVTDHDLQAEGSELLSQYNVVITGTHPEYYSGEMIDAWEIFLASGGRGMYLGGNGMYWVTVPHPEKPYLLEVRRGEAGDQAWKARPGEYHHSHNGERGGLWRHRARAPQKVWGTGMTSHSFARSVPFYPLPDARDERAAWIFEGLEPDAPIGDTGLVRSGAVGQEFDRYDLTLGTPPTALLLASSYGHTQYDMLVPEDAYFPGAHQNGEEYPLVRGDMTYFTTPNGGAMFATSSMTWATSLSWDDHQNSVAKVTKNVVARFASDEPLPDIS